MKIRIIGCSGSGKTYLAKKLSEKYNIKHFDLDDIQWDNTAKEYGVKMPVDKRNRLLNDILQQPDWIIEGVYYAWVQQSFADADIIYVLDMPKRLYKLRIIRRFIRRKLGFEKGKKESLKSLCGLLKWTETFQNTNMKDIVKILETYEDKVFFIKNKSEISKTISSLNTAKQNGVIE